MAYTTDLEDALMKTATLDGFYDEFEKIAARRGLKLIRDMVSAGDISGANRLAKTPGVLRNNFTGPEPFSDKNGRHQWLERTYAGSQIKHLGSPGSEQLSTLVADPTHGIAVRKVRHEGAIPPLAIGGFVKNIVNDPRSSQLAAKRLEDFRHEHSGSHMTMNEFVPGRNGSDIIGTSSRREGSLVQNEVNRIKGRLEDIGRQKGMNVQDVDPKNVVMQKGPDGKYHGKAIDLTASPTTYPGWPAKAATPPSKEEILRRAFRPSSSEATKYQSEKDAINSPPPPPPRAVPTSPQAKKVPTKQEQADMAAKAIEAFKAQGKSVTVGRPSRRRGRRS